MKDIQNAIAVKTIQAIVGNNDTEGTGVGVDLAGAGSALMIAAIGISGDTLSGSVYVTVKFQESNDNSTWNDIADADLGGGANSVVIDDAAEDDVVVQRTYKGGKRYVRVFVDFTGTHTNGIPIAAVIVTGNLRHAPATYTP